MTTPTHPIIVLGASAGGREALPVILENLPEGLPASVFVVQHLSSETMGQAFLKHLAKNSELPCNFAVDKEPIRPNGFTWPCPTIICY
nr:chemotaxis protein CheB [Adhaeribacter aquaticus]